MGLLLAQPAFTQHIGTMAYQMKKFTNTPPADLPPGERFLFVVDTSLSMRKLDAANRQALFDMVFSGLNGHMRNGDTFGIWTFNEQTYAGFFPMQVWKKEETLQLASRAALFLKNQTYERAAQVGILLVKLNSVIEAVGDVNVFLISDGDTPMVGTPFDRAVNASFEKRASDRRKSKKPFITTLVVRSRKVVSVAVTLAGEALTLPARAEPQLAKTSGAKPEVKPVESAPSPPAPKKMVINTLSNSTPQKFALTEITNAPALTVNAPTDSTLTASASASKNETKSLAPELTMTTVSPPAASVFAPLESQAAATNFLATGAAEPPLTTHYLAQSSTNEPPKRSSISLAPLTVAAREKNDLLVEPGSTASATLGVIAPEPLLNPTRMFVIGLALIIAAIGLVLLIGRRLRSAPQPSFITQSMERRQSVSVE